MADSDSTPPGKLFGSKNKAPQQEALNAFLVAAETLAQRGEVIESELRFKQALSTAEKEFGPQSDQAMLVLSILAAFYHHQNRTWDARAIESRLQAWQMAAEEEEPEPQGALTKKFAQRKKRAAALTQDKIPALKNLSPQLRKACQILGLSPENPITVQEVNKAWKKQMLETSAHPDLGGNADEAVILNRAKDELLEYLESRAPKLGAKFKKHTTGA